MITKNFYSIFRTVGGFTVAAMVLFMMSCQSNDNSSNDEPPVVDITKSTIAVNNNSAELSKRVTMYSNSEPLSKAKNGKNGIDISFDYSFRATKVMGGIHSIGASLAL